MRRHPIGPCLPFLRMRMNPPGAMPATRAAPGKLAPHRITGSVSSVLHAGAAALLGLIGSAAVLLSSAHADDLLVYTAHQEYDSRIYVLAMDGSVVDFFHYSFYRFTDLEVVDNQVYVAEAFAPRVYRVDIQTGDLELVIDDWSLYYFYDLGFDGTYFYLDEWDLNRYFLDGEKDGTADFDGTIFGSAWDGEYLWMLDDTGVMRAWDVSGWPEVVPAPLAPVPAPTADCRGLWHDGEHFWTAESKEVLGYIYQFDATGQVIDQWLQPAFSGWGVGVVQEAPSAIAGQTPVGGSRAGEAHGPGGSGCPEPLALEVASPCIARGGQAGRATVKFTLHQSGSACLQAIDVTGAVVSVLLDGTLSAGSQKIVWNPEGLPSGFYWLQLRAGEQTAAKKVLVTN